MTMRTGAVVCLALALLLGGCASSQDKKVTVEEPVAATSASTPAEAPPPAEPATPAAAAEAKAEPVPTSAVGKPAAVDDVVDLPAYPGASRTKLETSTVGSDGWSRKVKVELDVRDTFESVKGFYKKVIEDRGWTVTGFSEEEGKLGWKLAKDTSIGEVKIEKEGRKRVSVRLERKDR
ncbi:MAG: hypothetical protein MUF10_08705 [Thermoanaerobaculaceae bacterium]|jgi:hypothetical protein|nr:hypothetical protein [Thermoanaerobaculaceae bacterium]